MQEINMFLSLLNHYMKFWILFNFLIHFIGTVEFSEGIKHDTEHSKGVNIFNNNSQLVRIETFIEWISSLQPHLASYCIRIVPVGSWENNRDTLTANTWLANLGKRKVIITGNNLTSFQIEKPMLIIFVGEEHNSVHYINDSYDHSQSISDWIRSKSNRRYDQFIFVGKKFDLQSYWKDKDIFKLGHKWGYTVDTNEFVIRTEGDPQNPGFLTEIPKKLPYPFQIGSNIRGRHFNLIGFAHIPPYHFTVNEGEKENPIYDGTHVRLQQESSVYFNYTYKIDSSEAAGTYGKLLENGTWIGMVGELYNNEEYDLGEYLPLTYSIFYFHSMSQVKSINFANFVLSYYIAVFAGSQLIWHDMFDFGGSLSGAGMYYLTAKPKTEVQWQAFLYPFRPLVWLSLAIGFILVAILILLMLLPFSNSSVNSSIFITFKILIEQTTRIPRSTRAIAGAWLMFSIIVGTAYKSHVMSSLTFPFAETPPSTFQQLAYNKEYTPTLNNIGGLEEWYFRTNDSQVVTRIAERLQFEPNSLNCIAKAVLTKAACIGWFPFLEYLSAEGASPVATISPLYIATDPIMPTTVIVPFKKYSSFTDGFVPILMSFFESGIYTWWERDVLRIYKMKGVSNYNKNPTSLLNKKLMAIIENMIGSGRNQGLKMANLKMTFGILVAGVCVAVFSFACETIRSYLLVRHNSVTDPEHPTETLIATKIWYTIKSVQRNNVRIVKTFFDKINDLLYYDHGRSTI